MFVRQVMIFYDGVILSPTLRSAVTETPIETLQRCGGGHSPNSSLVSALTDTSCTSHLLCPSAVSCPPPPSNILAQTFVLSAYTPFLFLAPPLPAPLEAQDACPTHKKSLLYPESPPRWGLQLSTSNHSPIISQFYSRFSSLWGWALWEVSVHVCLNPLTICLLFSIKWAPIIPRKEPKPSWEERKHGLEGLSPFDTAVLICKHLFLQERWGYFTSIRSRFRSNPLSIQLLTPYNLKISIQLYGIWIRVGNDGKFIDKSNI